MLPIINHFSLRTTLLTQWLLLILLSASSVLVDAAPETEPRLAVYKKPNCGCCEKWITHLDNHGFTLTAHNLSNLTPFKRSKDIPSSMYSCHTAVSVDGFVFEGHIPAKYIQTFLNSPPEGATGLAVPAMPVGSPGMLYQDSFAPYKVFLLKDDGSSSVYDQVNSLKESLQ